MSATLVRVGGAPVSVWLMSHHLSQVDQGYYYTFSSLLSLQQAVEMGIGPRVVQFVSHEWGILTRSVDDTASLERANSRFYSLRVLARTYYYYATLVLILLLLGAGLAVFWKKDQHWAGPWLATVLFFCARFYFQRVANFLEGAGEFRTVYQIKAAEATLMMLTGWVALYTNQGLWVVPTVYCTSSVFSMFFLLKAQRNFVKILPEPPRHIEPFPWKSEIWPLFWRQGLSMAVGILSSVFPVILFSTRGAQEAGRFGLSWTLIVALSYNLANAYMVSFWPAYGMLAARGDVAALNQLHRRCRLRASLILCIGGLITIACTVMAGRYNLANRFLPLETTLLLTFGVLLQNLTEIESLFVRAHKLEPFVPFSLACSTIMGVGSWALTPRYGALAIAVLHVFVHLFIALPAAVFYANGLRKSDAAAQVAAPQGLNQP